MIHYLIEHWRSKPWLGWLTRLILSVVILALLFSRIDFSNLYDTLTAIRLHWLAPTLVIIFFIRWIWAYQMKLTLTPLLMRVTTWQLMKINLISSFYTLILPGSLVTGGAVSWYKLSRPTGQGAEALALLIHFRLINTLTLLAIGLVGVWFDPFLSSPNFRLIVGLMFLGVVGLLLPFFSSTLTGWLENYATPLLTLPFPDWLLAKSASIWHALKAFQQLSKRTLLLVLGLSLFSQLVGILNQYLLARALNIELSIFVLGWIRSLLGIIEMIPVSLAGLGIREVSLVLVMRNYGITEAQALSFSLAFFALIIIVGLVGGLLEGWDVFFGRLRSARQSGQSEGEKPAEVSV